MNALTQTLPRLTRAVLILLCAAAQTPHAAGPTQQLSLRFQEAAPPAPGALQLHFSGYHDSRCPADVACGFAGEAVALFWLTGSNIKPQVLALPWRSGEADWRQAITVGDFEFLLQSLEPRPLSTQSVAATEYRAVVLLRPRQRNKPAKTQR